MPNRRDFLNTLAAASLGVSSGAWNKSLGAFASQQSAAQRDQAQIDTRPPAATANNAMLVATTAPEAIKEGVALLQAGGSAADAVLSTALAQIALCAGCWVSYAGRMTAVYFNAADGSVHALNACYDAPREEDDPLSIPRSGTPSGRATLVPGFMAGVEALHQRFGKLDVERVFAKAIDLAEQGFPLSRNLASLIRDKSQVLTRFAGGRSVFLKPDDSLVSQGDHFRQPELAATLRGVVSDGAEFCYTGKWGRNFVAAVREAGGKISLEDMEKYEPTWSEPLRTRIAGNDVLTLPEPNRGGPMTCMALNLAEAARLNEHPPYSQSADALASVVRIEQAVRIAASPRGRALLAERLKREEFTLEECADAELCQQLWNEINGQDWDAWWRELNGLPMPKPSEHSDAVVAVDEAGNVAAILHTINTAGWGTTGLFVDGVSIPDSAAGQQQAVANAGPGGRIADHGPPLIVTRDDKPVLASSATGSGNVNASWQCVLNCLANGLSPQQAADQPRFYQGQFQAPELDAQLLEEIQQRGVIATTIESFGGFQMGFWAGLSIDRDPRVIRGGKIRRLNGLAIGY